MNQIQIVNIRPEHAKPLAELQRICFPTLGPEVWMTEDHFLNHCRIFPEGDFVALDGERVVGLGAGFFTDFDFAHPNHTFLEIVAGGYFTTHDPDGDYYYGADLSVHPDYRRRGIGAMLYKARQDLVQRYGKKGIVAGGALPGYPLYREQMTVHEYVERVVAGELYDPTLSFQLKNGFVVRGLLENYVNDSSTGNWATLIVWTNPETSTEG